MWVWIQNWAHFAEGRQVPVFALDQELRRDVPGRLHLAGLLVLLVELLHPLLGVHHLMGGGAVDHNEIMSANRVLYLCKHLMTGPFRYVFMNTIKWNPSG